MSAGRCRVVEQLRGQRPLEAGVLVLEVFSRRASDTSLPPYVALNLIEGQRGDAVLAANIHRLRSGLLFLQRPDDLSLP